MADSKITALTENTAPLGTDLLAIVDDPAGVPLTQKMTINKVGWTILKTGTDGEIPTFDASGNPAFVAVGTAAQVLTSNGAGAAPTFQAAAGGTTVTSFFISPPKMLITGNTNQSGYASTNTVQVFYQFYLPFTIVVNKITIKTGGTVTTAGTYDITIYSEDGQTQKIAVTTNSLSAGDTLYATTVAGVTLTPGIYYFGFNPNGTANVEINTHAASAIAGIATGWATDRTSEPKLFGKTTITAGTPATTIDPTALTEDTIGSVGIIAILDT